MIADLPAYSPDSPLFDKNRLVRTGASLDMLPPANGDGTTTAPDTDGVTTSADLGSIPSGVVGFGLSQLGVPGAVTSGVTAVTKSDNFTQLQDNLLSSLASTLGSAAVNAVLPGLPVAPAVGGALASEATKSNSNYGAAALSSGINAGAAVAGSMLAGPIGGLVAGALAGYATKSSLADGWLGDITDARTSETKRDAVEDAFGFSVGDTKGMASTQKGMDAFGVTDKGFGLDAAYGSTTAGQLADSAKQTGLLDNSSLMGYLDKLDSLASEFNDATPVTKTKADGWSPGMNPSNNAGGFLGDSEVDSRDREDDSTPGGLLGGRDGENGGSSGGGAGNAGGARGGGSEGNSGYW